MTKENFLSVAETFYAEFESLKGSPDFYDYEKSFVEVVQKMSCELLEKYLNEGSVTQDRRKKNTNPLRRNICSQVS
jgi:hypothetical protein